VAALAAAVAAIAVVALLASSKRPPPPGVPGFRVEVVHGPLSRSAKDASWDVVARPEVPARPPVAHAYVSGESGLHPLRAEVDGDANVHLAPTSLDVAGGAEMVLVLSEPEKAVDDTHARAYALTGKEAPGVRLFRVPIQP
jgi:hypothetical protein